MTETATETPKGRGPGRPRGLGKVPGSGRQPGTPNKRTAEVRELLLSLKCDPITGMARIAMNAKNPAELRGKMYSELAQYMWPKRRAIEHTGDPAPLITKIQRIIIESGDALAEAAKIEQGGQPFAQPALHARERPGNGASESPDTPKDVDAPIDTSSPDTTDYSPVRWRVHV